MKWLVKGFKAIKYFFKSLGYTIIFIIALNGEGTPDFDYKMVIVGFIGWVFVILGIALIIFM